MTLEKTIKWRRTVRKYCAHKPIGQKKIYKILNAGLYAPSSLGLEVTKVIAIQNKDLKTTISNKTLMSSNIDKGINCDTLFILLGLKADIVNSPKFLKSRLLRFYSDDEKKIASTIETYQNYFKKHYQDNELSKYVSEQVHITVSFMALQAASLKLGTTIMGGIDSNEATKILLANKLIDKNYQVELALAVGYFDVNDPGTFLPQRRIMLEEFGKIIK